MRVLAYSNAWAANLMCAAQAQWHDMGSSAAVGDERDWYIGLLRF